MSIKPKTDTILWDIGNVLIYWDPRNIYRDDQCFGSEDLNMWSERVIKAPWAPGERGWNTEMDMGRTFAETYSERVVRFPDLFPDLVEKFPHYANLLEKYGQQFELAMKDRVPGTDDIRRLLKRSGYRTLALSNFSKETWPRIAKLHPLMNDFDGAVVSGYVGMVKPDDDIFIHCIDKLKIIPSRTIFIDDSIPNLETARRFDFHTIHFTPDPMNPSQAIEQLMKNLQCYGIQCTQPMQINHPQLR